MKNLFSSSATTVIMLCVYAIVLAIATIIEKFYGTAIAKAEVYHAPWFLFYQGTLVLHLIFVLVVKHCRRYVKLGMLIVHCAFIVILLGALVSFLTGEEGILHLREGETGNRLVMLDSGQRTEHELPFAIELKNFELSRYPGSSSPSSYESVLVIHKDGESRSEHISMNNVLDIQGYRFFQASYDEDEQGTVLSVNHDIAGRYITYSGYFLLATGFLIVFLSGKSRFSRLRHRLKRLYSGRTIAFLFFLHLSTFAFADISDLSDIVRRHAVSPSHAKKFAALPMQSPNGRVMPISTFSSELLRKLHKSTEVKGINSDQFLLSVLLMPDVWMRLPFISLPGEDICGRYGLSGGYCAYTDLFTDDGSYKLQKDLETIYRKKVPERSLLDKDVLKLDERINLFHQLLNRQLLSIFPLDNAQSNKWYAPGDDLSLFIGKDSMFVSKIFDWYLDEVRQSILNHNQTEADRVLDMIVAYQNAKASAGLISSEKLEAECRYNALQPFRLCRIGYLLLGGALLLTLFGIRSDRRCWGNILHYVLLGLALAVFHLHMYGMGMRWYISGHAPWSNSYETMVYVAWAIVLAGLLFARRNVLSFALSLLFAGVILFVAGLNWMDPEITPLVPVLKSPWLMFHVAVIVAAYGFFGISWLIGMSNMVLFIITGHKSRRPERMLQIEELSILNEMSLWVGLALMTVGTFLGAVWANETWGRYWGWDPKETWALITILVYAVVTHVHLLKCDSSLWLFNVLSVWAFASVLMTYFGVNYFLNGMHAYGYNEGAGDMMVYGGVLAGVCVLFTVFSYIRWKKTDVVADTEYEIKKLKIEK